MVGDGEIVEDAIEATEYRHVGAYGLLERGGAVLLVRKERGPYRGRFDLPGGGIDFGEHPVSALCREFVEETGLILTEHSLIGALSNRVRYRLPSGGIEDMHHLGLIYRVVAADSSSLKTEPDGEDSGGAVWVESRHVDRIPLTPFARSAVGGKNGDGCRVGEP